MNATDAPASSESATINNPGPGTAYGGLKATWHPETLTGKEAHALLEMQNQAIINLLTWAASYEKSTSSSPASDHETGANVSRETLELAA